MLANAHPQPPGHEKSEDAVITLRHAAPDDAPALIKLAQLDSAKVPPSPVLMAEVGGEVRAAISLRDGSTIADPFHRTGAILELLTARAEHLRIDRMTRARRVGRVLVRAIAGAQ